MRENTPFSEMIDTETDDDGVQCTYRSILVNNLGDEQDQFTAAFRGNHLSKNGGDARLGYALIQLTPHQAWNALKAATRCALCGFVFKNRRQKKLDHDHVTGKFRGVVCAGCNILLGYFDKLAREGWAQKVQIYLDRV